jgi:hypothetical protein
MAKQMDNIDQNTKEMNQHMKELLKNVSFMHYHISEKISVFFLENGNFY